MWPSWTRDRTWQVEGSPYISYFILISCSFSFYNFLIVLFDLYNFFKLIFIYLFILQCCVGFCCTTMQISHTSHVYRSFLYLFLVLHSDEMKPCLLFLWVAFITRPFRELFAASSFSKVSQVTSQGLPPLTGFFSNEACASEEKNSFHNSHGYTKLPFLLDSHSCLQSEKDMDTRTPTTISNGIWLSDYHRVKSVVCRRLLGRNHKTRMTTRGHEHTFNNIYLQKPREDFCCKGREEWIT